MKYAVITTIQGLISIAFEDTKERTMNSDLEVTGSCTSEHLKVTWLFFSRWKGRGFLGEKITSSVAEVWLPWSDLYLKDHILA